MTTIETNWDEIPEEYKYTAVDRYGAKYAYTDTPILIGELWWPGGEYKHVGTVNCGFWDKSLRERPSVITSVTSLDDITVASVINMYMESNITFCNQHGDVGKLEWTNGIMEFEGNATESAKAFMDELQRQFNTAIEIEIERRVKEAQSE